MKNIIVILSNQIGKRQLRNSFLIVALGLLMLTPSTVNSDPSCPKCTTIIPNCSENCSLSFEQDCNGWEYTIWCNNGYENTWDGIGQWASGGNTLCGGVTPCIAIAP